jgi:peptide/nickel transport system permease protein
MFGYVVNRLALMVPTLVFALAIVFFGMRILPTDIADLIVENAPFGGAAFTKTVIRRQLNLDKPLIVQFGAFLLQLGRGDLGTSAYDRRPVSERISTALPPTLELTFLSMTIAIVVALIAGITSAVYQDSVLDLVVRVFSILTFAAPLFWIGTMVIVFPAIWWRYFPPLFYQSLFQSPRDNLREFLPPALVLGLTAAGYVARMVRSSLLEVLRHDYVRTARAKGLSEAVVLTRHALRNSFTSVVSFLGLQLTTLLGGVVIVETIFAMPGLGSLVLTAVTTKDYPVIQGAVLVLAVIVLLVNLAVDLSYAFVDPRIRYQ